jgi:hypothetical protein
MNHEWVLPTLGSAMLLAGCGSGQSDWNRASKANTVAGYETYLRRHPDGEYRAEADERITQLNDDQAWARATAAHSTQGLRAYLAREPEGVHSQQAKASLEAVASASD